MKNLDDFFTEKKVERTIEENLERKSKAHEEGSNVQVPQAANFKFAHMADCHWCVQRERTENT